MLNFGAQEAVAGVQAVGHMDQKVEEEASHEA